MIGFPLGCSTTRIFCDRVYTLGTKLFETQNAIQEGANEIDMVLAIGMIKSKNYSYVLEEIRSIHEVCQKNGCLLKVIIEIYP